MTKNDQSASYTAKILVVDDEANVQALISEVLREVGYYVETAFNGRAALQKLERCDYDLIITNIWMPVMDGITFYRHLCQMWPHLAERVIFCTGDVFTLEVWDFLNNIGNPVLVKPFNIGELIQVVARMLGTVSKPYRLVETDFPLEHSWSVR